MAKGRKSTKRGGTRKTAKYKGLTIVLPKGSSKLTAAHKAKVDSAGGGRGKDCRGVFFTATKYAVRCSSRKLSTSAKRRFRDAGGKRSCMKKAGKRFVFKSC
jgi:hypothetical protein